MPKREFSVNLMQRDEEHAVVGALTRAFYNDPLFGFFFPHLVRQTRGLMAFMGAGVADAKPFNEIWVARAEDGKIASAAAWLPPGGYPRGVRRETMTLLRSSPTFLRAGRRIVASLRLLAESDKAHHEIKEPHYYLALLGTDPLYQRTGAGSAALQPVLERCDTEGVSAYLETQKEANLAYYARHRFDLARKLEVKGAPPLWTMLRKPK
jgi:GNAT superfamily N-acetyltransferase